MSKHMVGQKTWMVSLDSMQSIEVYNIKYGGKKTNHTRVYFIIMVHNHMLDDSILNFNIYFSIYDNQLKSRQFSFQFILIN